MIPGLVGFPKHGLVVPLREPPTVAWTKSLTSAQAVPFYFIYRVILDALTGIGSGTQQIRLTFSVGRADTGGTYRLAHLTIGRQDPGVAAYAMKDAPVPFSFSGSASLSIATPIAAGATRSYATDWLALTLGPADTTLVAEFDFSGPPYLPKLDGTAGSGLTRPSGDASGAHWQQAAPSGAWYSADYTAFATKVELR